MMGLRRSVLRPGNGETACTMAVVDRPGPIRSAWRLETLPQAAIDSDVDYRVTAAAFRPG
jgi:hypothetical protein